MCKKNNVEVRDCGKRARTSFLFEKLNVNCTELKTKVVKVIHVNVWIELNLCKMPLLVFKVTYLSAIRSSL